MNVLFTLGVFFSWITNANTHVCSNPKIYHIHPHSIYVTRMTDDSFELLQLHFCGCMYAVCTLFAHCLKFGVCTCHLLQNKIYDASLIITYHNHIPPGSRWDINYYSSCKVTRAVHPAWRRAKMRVRRVVVMVCSIWTLFSDVFCICFLLAIKGKSETRCVVSILRQKKTKKRHHHHPKVFSSRRIQLFAPENTKQKTTCVFLETVYWPNFRAIDRVLFFAVGWWVGQWAMKPQEGTCNNPKKSVQCSSWPQCREGWQVRCFLLRKIWFGNAEGRFSCRTMMFVNSYILLLFTFIYTGWLLRIFHTLLNLRRIGASYPSRAELATDVNGH